MDKAYCSVRKGDIVSHLSLFVYLVVSMSWFRKRKSTDAASSESIGALARLQEGLRKTRAHFGEGIGRLLLGKKSLSPEILESLEHALLSADVGVEMTSRLIDPLAEGLKRKELQDGSLVFNTLKAQLIDYLEPASKPLVLPQQQTSPFVILIVGVNGAGKTTTLAKLARQWQLQGKKVMMAAGDTFRAAAIEQLQAWGARYDIPVVAQAMGADSSAVIFDAWQSAKAKGIDILLADTAGRLHTQSHLMDELKKIKRVLQKVDQDAPQEVMLVLDAGIGQNALVQAKQFHEAVGLTGISLTKFDGTAKGGMVFTLAQTLGLPFRYIGVGEAIEDLRPFDAKTFVEAIFYHDTI